MDGSGRRKVVYGELDDRLGYVLRRAQIAVFQMFFDAFAQAGIRIGQYSVLTIIEHNPGLSQTQVAEALGIKKTNFVAVIDTLEGRGLVRRAATPNDRRSYALFLTAEGRALMPRLHAISAEHEQQIIDRVGAGQHQRLFAPLRSLAAMADQTDDGLRAAGRDKAGGDRLHSRSVVAPGFKRR